MHEKFFPIILAAISETSGRCKMVKNPEEYDAFYARFDKPDTEIRELKTPRSIYLEWMARINPNIRGWTRTL